MDMRQLGQSILFFGFGVIISEISIASAAPLSFLNQESVRTVLSNPIQKREEHSQQALFQSDKVEDSEFPASSRDHLQAVHKPHPLAGSIDSNTVVHNPILPRGQQLQFYQDTDEESDIFLSDHDHRETSHTNKIHFPLAGGYPSPLGKINGWRFDLRSSLDFATRFGNEKQ